MISIGNVCPIVSRRKHCQLDHHGNGT